MDKFEDKAREIFGLLPFEEFKDYAEQSRVRQVASALRAAHTAGAVEALREAATSSEKHFWKKDRPGLYDWTAMLRIKADEREATQ